MGLSFFAAIQPVEALPGGDGGSEPSGDVVLVAFSDCEAEPLGKQAFLKVLALELGRPKLREAPPEAAAVSLDYRCDGTARVRMRLRSPELERQLRVDDVAIPERARALALAVAELARGGEPSSSKPESEPDSGPPSGAPKPASDEPAAPAKRPAPRPDAARSEGPRAVVAPERAGDSAEPGGDERAAERVRLRALLAAGARLNLDVRGYCYGGMFGLDYAAFRLLLEGCGAVTSVTRGTITTGVAAARVGRAQPIARLGAVAFGVEISGAAGVNWAVGNSTVVNTHVRRVLMPYADARLGLFATSSARAPFTPLVQVYGGRALGIVSNADGEAAAATGGWFTGAELGLWL